MFKLSNKKRLILKIHQKLKKLNLINNFTSKLPKKLKKKLKSQRKNNKSNKVLANQKKSINIK